MIYSTFRTHGHLGNGRCSHENNRYQSSEYGYAEARHFLVSENLRAVHALWNVWTNISSCAAENRTGNNSCWYSNDSTVEQGGTNISTIDNGNGSWAWMWWQEAMGYGQGCCHWYACLQQRYISRGCNGEYQRNQQDKTNFIEQGNTYHKTCQAHSPSYILLAKNINQCGGNTLGSAAFSHELAQHGTKGYDNGQAA